MRLFIILICIIVVWSCHKSQTEKQPKINCGCDTDSVLNVCVDSTGWLSYDSTFKQYSILDTVQYDFLNIYWICNPKIKDVTSITFSNNNPVEVYYSERIEARCFDSLVTVPEVSLLNITIDSLRKNNYHCLSH